MSDELRLYSVTSMMKLAMGNGDALLNWAVNTTAEAAYDRHNILHQFIQDGDRDGAVKWLKDQRWAKTGAAAARGTELHKAAEKLALGQQPDIPDEHAGYLEQYERFLSEHQPQFHMAEAPVYNPAAGYAGTLDAVLTIDGQTVVADIKTTPHAPDSGRSRPPYPEVALQLCMYRRATDVGVLAEQRYASGKRYYLFNPDQHHEPMPDTDGAVCIVVSPFDYMVVPVRTDELVWRYCRHMIEMARWSVSVSKTVLGPPITAKGVAA
ncbi:MAG: hypothetical protein OEV62_03335 [Actinomycetota bacterium]|nr:hypothetical protein [Actinomycetota bacterium]